MVHGYVIFLGPPRLAHGLCEFGLRGPRVARIRFDMCDQVTSKRLELKKTDKEIY